MIASLFLVFAIAWAPPVGIPAPSFGIEQVTPAQGVPLTSWPATMQPGSVAVLTGAIRGGTLVCNGTAEKPCWILGGTATLTGDFNVLGSYTILDGLHFTGQHSLGIGGDHNVVRNSTSVGTKADPTGAAIYVDGTDCLVWRNRVTDHGDKTAKIDTDAHGISVVRPAQRTWILENESARNAGDGINVNPYPYDAQTWSAIGYVYIGRNISHDNKQTGIWTKGSHDIVVSQNELYGHVVDPEGFSTGSGAGNQYSPNRIWYLYNDIHNNDVGVTTGGALENASFADPAPTYDFLIGNRLSHITGSDGCGAGDVWTCAAFFLTGPGQYLLVDNALSDVLETIHVTRGAGFSEFRTTGMTRPVVNEGVPPFAIPGNTITADTAYIAFQQAYGLDVHNGVVPADGTVGPGGTAVPPPVVIPPPVVTPPPPVVTPPPPPVKVLPPCPTTKWLTALYHWLGLC